MDYEPVNMSKNEIVDYYSALDIPTMICPLYQGEPTDWGLKPRV